MRVVLIKDNKLLKYKLPLNIEGNFWLDEIDDNGISRNIINIEATEDKNWRVVSNDNYYVFEKNNKVQYKILDEKSIVIFNHAYSYNNMLLFTEPLFDNSFSFYLCNEELKLGLNFGTNSSNQIVNNISLAGDRDLSIKLENGKIYIEDLNSKYGIFNNNSKVIVKEEYELGNVIYYLGMRIILLKESGNYVIGISNNYNLIKTYLTPYNLKKNMGTFTEESVEVKDMEIYSQDDYFYRKPRFIYSTNTLNVSVDSPPSAPETDDTPMILVIGPMLTMSMTSLMTFYTTMTNINSGQQTVKQAMPQLVMSGAMMLSFFLWPMITNFFQKSMRKKKEKKRVSKYSTYIDELKKKIEDEKKVQEEIMKKSNLDLILTEKVILERQDRLWERRVFDDDFLDISLGNGTLPMNINISIPEEHFSLNEDTLLKKMDEVNNYRTLLDNVPITFSFKQNYISALIGENKLQKKIMDNIILELMAYHGYESLKIVVFTSRDKKNYWDKYKTLPHMWTNGKNMRYFASNEEEYKEVSYNLDKIYNERLEKINENRNENEYNTCYLIIVDTYTAVRNLELFNKLINSKEYLGFSLLILNDRISNLPDQCQTFIELDDNESKISRNVSNDEGQKFKIDFTNIDLNKCISVLSNTPLELKDEGEGAIPKKVGFLEMYGLGKIEQFNSKTRWIENSPIMNMGALVGIGQNGEKISLDLHEKYHGPHGLIAGMTGSGKSEFIITYILSLAVNYHPDEVQFILIDYKGGGLAGAFENQTTGIKLPHLVGVITNLDKNEINRSLASIESELKRRQKLFNKARELSEESTIDIYKYQEMYRNHIVDEPVSHLLIIADEFAELKQQQPEFMEQLISTARIGRSLGVHLILATQKPSGVVDSQIWSNTRFRVCLRVQEKNDSSEVIKRPDAAYLTQTGRFYLQVGFNEIFLLGQSAWTGGKYFPSDNINKNIDTSIDFVNNIGYITKNIETKKEVKINNNYGEELINIVKYLDSIAKEDKINVRSLWLSRIPNFILVTDLIKKYNYGKRNYILEPIIGEYDVPTMQEQRLLTIPFTRSGNAIVYGIAGSGKENFITTMIFSSMIAYLPNEVNYYILDFGSESLKYFNNSPYVGDIVYINENEKIENLFKMIQNEMDNRKKLFANYNGDFINYCKNSGEIIPNIVIVINNFEGYQESYPQYEDLLNVLTRDSIKYGIYFVLTVNTPNGIRFKLKQNFGQIFALQQNSDDDYSTILGNVRKMYPSRNFGRGLIKYDGVYEYQTAFVTEKENIPNYMRSVNEKLCRKYNYRAKKIPVLPEIVSINDVSNDLVNNEIGIGIDENDLTVSKYDFTNDKINIVTTNDLSNTENFINNIICQYINKKTFTNIVINAEDILVDNDLKKSITYVDNNFDSVFDTVVNYISNAQEKYKNENMNKDIFKNVSKINCIIIGLNSFKSRLNQDNQTKFDKMFNDEYDLDIINYIFIDTVDKLKKFSYDNWFKEGINSSNGIYIGNGIQDQMLLNISKKIPEMKEDIASNFGFVISRGIPKCVKFVEEYKNNL